MSIDRPLNEYENALFSAVITLISTVVSIGADRSALAAKFREGAQDAARDNRESEAALSEILAKFAESDGSYVPNSPFRVIKGDKD